jgi:hypothetical protein
LPLKHRTKVILKTMIVVCGLPLLLATASFCVGNWPPSKSNFNPVPTVDGVIDVRILDSGLSGFRSYLYQIDIKEGRVLELENKSLSSEEFANPPWHSLPGGHIDTGGSHSFAGIVSPNGQYVALSSGISRPVQVKSRSSWKGRGTTPKLFGLQFRLAIMCGVSLGRRIRRLSRYFCLRSDLASGPWTY